MAAATDLFQYVGNETATNLSSPYTSGGTTVTVNSTAGWPTTTGVTFAIDSIAMSGTDEVQTPGTLTLYHGVVANGTTISNVVLATESPNSAQNYAAGSLTRVYMPVSAAQHNRMAEGILNHADQDGTLKAGAVDNAAVLASDVVTTAKILDANVTSDKVAAGMVVQVVTATYSAVATGTTTMPYDDTIPQNTEGNQIMTLAITPKSATNLLVIEVNAQLAHSAITNVSAALFQDSTANALAAGEITEENANFVKNVPILHRMVAGTTSSTTFNVRAGGSDAGTLTFNGTNGNRRFGGITTSWIKITEIKA